MDLHGRFQQLPRRIWKWILILIGVFVLTWISFLDSHSLLSRIQMYREKSQIEQDTTRLRARIRELEKQLARPLTDEEVERIAREDYGMTKPGETVYPVTRDQ
jgi:cell division protein FtsB